MLKYSTAKDAKHANVELFYREDAKSCTQMLKCSTAKDTKSCIQMLKCSTSQDLKSCIHILKYSTAKTINHAYIC